MRILIFCYFLLLTACDILPKPAAVHDFGNPAGAAHAGIGAAAQPAVTVDAPKWLYDNRIRYRLLYAAPTQVRFYSLDRWLAPPPELFEHLLANNGARWLVPITISLNAFEQQFAAPGSAQVMMQVTATRFSADNKQAVSKRDFTLKQLCPTPDAKGAVAGFSVLARQAAQDIMTWANLMNGDH